MQKATQQQTKEHNRHLVLKTIMEGDTISRAEIARVTSLTRTTVSDIVSDLLQEGLVSEVGIGESQGGKNPILLSLVDDSRYLIGLDLAQNHFLGAVVNLRGQIQTMVSQEVNNCSGEDAVRCVYSIIDQLVNTTYRPLVGIGVGTPGLVNTSEGVVLNAVNLDWHNLPLAQLLRSRYALPVTVLNDSQAAALGEFTYGYGRRSSGSMVVINARRGIGAGIIINNQLFQGDGGGAGEIGHTVVVAEGGHLCRCGKMGCLETVASAQALLRDARHLAETSSKTLLPNIPAQVNLAAVQHAYESGDPAVCELVDRTARYMGWAVSSLVGTLNIHKIVMTGNMTCFGQPWLQKLRETVSETALAGLVKETQVELGRLGEHGILLGASAVLANNYSLLFNAN